MTDSRSASLIAEIRVPAEHVVLSEALAAVPETTVEFEQSVPTNPSPMPFLWAIGGARSAFESAVAGDPTVESLTLIDDLDEGGLFRSEWRDIGGTLLDRFHGGGEEVLRAVGRADEWFLEVRFGDREALGAFRTYCAERNFGFTLLRLYEAETPKLGRFGLTARQYEALVTGLELGYFDVPRGATLADVAAELDLSSNAVSERIRRGETSLLRSALTVDMTRYRDRFG